MTEFQCPNCAKADIVEQMRLQNPKNGKTVESASLGCIYEIALTTTLIAILAVGFAIWRPTHPFAEAAALIGLITMIFVAAGIFITWRYSNWLTMRRYTCKACGHTWEEEPRQLAPR